MGLALNPINSRKGIIGLKGKRVLRRQKGPKGNKKKGRRASMVNNQDKIIALLGGSGPTSKTAQKSQNSALSFPLFPIFNPSLLTSLSLNALCLFALLLPRSSSQPLFSLFFHHSRDPLSPQSTPIVSLSLLATAFTVSTLSFCFSLLDARVAEAEG